MLRQFCNDTSDSVLIKNNGVAPDWGCNPFSSDSIVFNENSIASVIANVNADAWRKQDPNVWMPAQNKFLLLYLATYDMVMDNAHVALVLL